MEKIQLWLKDYTDELLYKVQWPTFEELQSSTIIVFVSCLLLAVVIFAMDFAFGNIMKLLYGLF